MEVRGGAFDALVLPQRDEEPVLPVQVLEFEHEPERVSHETDADPAAHGEQARVLVGEKQGLELSEKLRKLGIFDR